MNAPVAYPLTRHRLYIKKPCILPIGHKNHTSQFVECAMQKQQLAVGKC